MQREWIAIWIALLSCIVSLVSALFTLVRSSPYGEIAPIEPSGYAIRNVAPYQTEERFDEASEATDHLVFPLEWRNDSGRHFSMKVPILVLTEVETGGELTESTVLGQGDGPIEITQVENGSDPRETEPCREPSRSQLCFFLIGEYPAISDEALTENPYTFKDSVLLEPHSVTHNVLVFRIAKWWKEPNRRFEFEPGKRYEVEIRYRKIQESSENPEDDIEIERATLLRDLCIQESVQNPSFKWDYFSLAPGSRASDPENCLSAERS